MWTCILIIVDWSTTFIILKSTLFFVQTNMRVIDIQLFLSTSLLDFSRYDPGSLYLQGFLMKASSVMENNFAKKLSILLAWIRHALVPLLLVNLLLCLILCSNFLRPFSRDSFVSLEHILFSSVVLWKFLSITLWLCSRNCQKTFRTWSIFFVCVFHPLLLQCPG